MKYTSWVAKAQAEGGAWVEKHIRTIRAETQVHAQPSSPLRSFNVSCTCVQLTEGERTVIWMAGVTFSVRGPKGEAISSKVQDQSGAQGLHGKTRKAAFLIQTHGSPSKPISSFAGQVSVAQFTPLDEALALPASLPPGAPPWK